MRYYAPTLQEDRLSDGSVAWVAFCVAFPGVLAQGRTREEALAVFQEMLEDAVEHYREHGLSLPEPNGLRVEVELGDGPVVGCSGARTGLSHAGAVSEVVWTSSSSDPKS